VVGAIVCFVCILVLLKFWRPAEVLGYGGVPVPPGAQAAAHGLSERELVEAWLPIGILVAVVVAWTGPWSSLTAISGLRREVAAASSMTPGATITAVFNWTPFVGGTAIFVSWLIVALLKRINGRQLAEIWSKTWQQMWGAMLVGVFIFGLAYVYNFSGMAASLASAFAKIGTGFILVAPILGWIGVALSGSNTSTNAMFGKFQALVGQILGFPPLLLPTLNSVGAEIGKPVAPQTASVGVSTTRFVRDEGAVIRHNMGWTFILLGYLILIGVGFYLFFPSVGALP
jgi:lactate permease